MGQEVRFRRVFYVPGFDPSPPRRYREMYRTEAAAQAAVSGYRIEVSGRSGGSAYGWRARAEIGGRRVEADFEVLVWSDIVRGAMKHGILSTYAQLARTVWAYVGSGALSRLFRLRKGPMIAAIYPVAFLLIELAIAVLLGRVAAGLLGAASAYVGAGRAGAMLVSAAVLGAVTGAVLWAFRRADGRVHAW